MSERLSGLTPSTRSPEEEELFRTLVEGPRGKGIVLADGSLFGPFNAMLRSPGIGDRLQALGLALHGPDALPAVLREVVILTVVGRRECIHEWNAHRPRAVAAGVSEEDLTAIETGGSPTDANEQTRLALELAHAQLEHRDVEESLYGRAIELLGERRVFELTALVGYYDGICSIITIFHLDD